MVASPKCAFVPSQARDAEQPHSRLRTNQFGRALNCLKLLKWLKWPRQTEETANGICPFGRDVVVRCMPSDGAG